MSMKLALFFAVCLVFASTFETDVDRNLQAWTGFSYTTGGADWPGACSTGLAQSPIDIETTSGSCDNSMVFDISFASSITYNITNTGMFLKATGAFSTLFATDINGILTGYTATHVHFHAPAEHTVEGNTYDLEMQIVHKINTDFKAKGTSARDYAIVSLLFVADSSATTNSFIDALKVGTLNVNMTQNWQTLLGTTLPSPIPYYTYQGSWTTPTCGENVNWFVMKISQAITTTQLSSFASYWANNATFGAVGNNRPIQDKNGRTVKKGGVECEEQFVYFFSFFILYIFINYFIFKLL